jgi:hypothetical protein
MPVAFIFAVDVSLQVKAMPTSQLKPEDRRIFERIPARFSVRFRDQVSSQWGLAQTQDISATGFGIVSEAELMPHTPLEIWLPLPNKGETLYTRGEVVWSEGIGQDKFRAGVCLERPDLMGIAQVLRPTQTV